jgi:DNA-binding CsgD family transcriptional regulator
MNEITTELDPPVIGFARSGSIAALRSTAARHPETTVGRRGTTVRRLGRTLSVKFLKPLESGLTVMPSQFGMARWREQITELGAPLNGDLSAIHSIMERGAAATDNRGLRGRREESAVLEWILAGARSGAGGSLVLRGEPGIGRTSLLEYAVGHAHGMRVARLAGIDSETGLGFAALHRLLFPIAPRLDGLPGRQLGALRAAFGLTTADIPDRFMVSLAALALLADLAAEQPLLVAVDDAQWLDRATIEVLGFVARRLTTEPIAFVIAVREPTIRCQSIDGLPTLYLNGLPEQDAHELLAAVATGPLDRRMAQRVVAETAGNPLALVELGRQITDGQCAAGMPAPQPLPIGGRLKDQFLRSVQTLPSGTQTLLLLVAAEPSGSPALLRRAAARLGLGANVAGPAEAAGLLASADRVTFRHPLVRSAVYYGAPPRERRRVHAALAAVIDPVSDPDSHGWHLAAAAGGPDEGAASGLVRSAARARAKADHAAEAMLLTRAAELTPDRKRRADRLLDCAAAVLAAGEPVYAETLLDQADPSLLGPPARARTAQLRATVSLVGGRFREAPSALLRAARELHPLEPQRARETLLDAMYAGLVAGVQAGSDVLPDIAHAALSWPAQSPPTAGDLMLRGFATRLTAGYRAAVPALRSAVDALIDGTPLRSAAPRLLAMGWWAAGELLDGDAQQVLVPSWKQIRGDAGTDNQEPGIAVSDIAGAPGPSELLQLVWHGGEVDARSALAANIRSSVEAGAELGVSTARHAVAVLELGQGRYEAALASALTVYTDDPPYLGTHILPDLVEAAVRCGDHSAARSGLERLAERALASGTQLAAGLLARSRALLAGSAEAEVLYQEAIEHLRQSTDTVQLARAHLLYGEWLRRQRRRRDARQQLRTARDTFDAVRFEAFAQRSCGELLATGERASKRTGDITQQLTPQEMQVARLVAEGSSNRQVAAQMFISPNTVEYHLQKVFRKVGVSSRTQLARSLLDQTSGNGIAGEGFYEYDTAATN